MYNTEKSWKGEPVTNQFICPNPYDSNNNVLFNVNGTGTFQRVYSGTYGGYTIKPTDVVYRYNLGGNGCHYHGNSAAIASGQYVCYSVDYYISPDASDYPTDSTLVVLENYGGSALGGGTGAGGNGIMGKWQTIRGYSGPTSGSGTQAMFLYPGGCGNSYMASRGFILMKNPMFEFRGDVRYNRFVNGTRSNTQAVLDLTGQNTITAQSLTYNTDGTFSFNGSNYINSSLSNISNFTVEIAFKSDSVENYRNPIDCNWLRFNGSYSNIGPRLEQSSSGNLTWLIGDTSGNYDTRTVVTSGLNQAATHVATIVKDNLNYTSYYNGTQVQTGTAAYTWPGNFNDIQIGRGFSTSSERWFIGKIYYVRIYNRALSASEVTQNFAAQRGLYGL